VDWSPITKDPAALARRPNLSDYPSAYASFRWDSARAALAGLPGGGLNMAHEALFRHAEGGRAGQLAIRFIAEG
jgi:acetyl-CoA synthetase